MIKLKSLLNEDVKNVIVGVITTDDEVFSHKDAIDHGDVWMKLSHLTFGKFIKNKWRYNKIEKIVYWWEVWNKLDGELVADHLKNKYGVEIVKQLPIYSTDRNEYIRRYDKSHGLSEMKRFDPKKYYYLDPKPNKTVADLVDSILKDISNLIHEYGFRNIKINYVTHNTDALADFSGIIDSTVDPVFTMSTQVLYRWVKKYGHNLSREVERVLVHELNHAYLEMCGLDLERQNKDIARVERVVDEVAQEFVEDRNVEKAKQTLDDFVEDYSFHTGHITEDVECPRCNGWKVVYVRPGIPNIYTKCPVCVDIPKTINVYRGVSECNKKYDNFWTTKKEWARQFTQSGLDREIKRRTIDTSVIMKRENAPLPRATSDKDFDQAIKDAEFGKFDAFWVNEAQGQPPSIYVMNLSVLK